MSRRCWGPSLDGKCTRKPRHLSGWLRRILQKISTTGTTAWTTTNVTSSLLALTVSSTTNFLKGLHDRNNHMNDNEHHFISHVLAFFAGSDSIINNEFFEGSPRSEWPHERQRTSLHLPCPRFLRCLWWYHKNLHERFSNEVQEACYFDGEHPLQDLLPSHQRIIKNPAQLEYLLMPSKQFLVSGARRSGLSDGSRIKSQHSLGIWWHLQLSRASSSAQEARAHAWTYLVWTNLSAVMRVCTLTSPASSSATWSVVSTPEAVKHIIVEAVKIWYADFPFLRSSLCQHCIPRCTTRQAHRNERRLDVPIHRVRRWSSSGFAHARLPGTCWFRFTRHQNHVALILEVNVPADTFTLATVFFSSCL